MKQLPLLLASQSPFRKKLMEQIGLQFIAEKPMINEDQVRKTLTVAIDCLLYTSPSPRDATLSRMPSSA